MNRWERYVKVVRWAARRYTENGLLRVSVGGKPTRFARIEKAAARKYLTGIMPANFIE
jgi:hypothetical protein